MLIERAAISERDVLHAEGDCAVLNVRVACGRDVIWPVLWDQHKVGMRHAVAVDDHPDAFRREDDSHTAANALRGNHDLLGGRVIEIGEVIDVGAWNDSHSPGAKGRRVMKARMVSSE